MQLQALLGLQDCNGIVSTLLQFGELFVGSNLVRRRRERGPVRCSMRLGSRPEEDLVLVLSTLKVPATGEHISLVTVLPDAGSGC